MKTSWESFPHYVQLTNTEVIIGSNPGRNGHTDNATALSHVEFLQGKGQDLILDFFNEEILGEVMEAVQQKYL